MASLEFVKRDFYVDLAARVKFEATSMSSHPHVPLSRDFDENVVEGLLVETAYLDSEGNMAFWRATVKDIKGALVKLRWLGARADSDKEFFWRNFLTYKELDANQLDERIYPVGWAADNLHRLEPPRDLRESHQDWDSHLEQQIRSIQSRVLLDNLQEIAHLESESNFKPGMGVELMDVEEMHKLRRGTIKEIVGLRIKFSYTDDDGSEQDCWLHEDSDDFRPEGWHSVIGREIKASPEYKESSANRIRRLREPPLDDEVTSANFKPLLMPRFLEEYIKTNSFKKGLQLEVIDPLRPGISVGTIVEVLGGGYLVIEIVHERLRKPGEHKRYKICAHAYSASLLAPGFARRNGLMAYFNPPRENFRYDKKTMVPAELLKKVIPRQNFRRGQRLEVVGVSASNLFYAGSIVGIFEHLLLIHFEGWDKKHDHFFSMSSLDLYPVGYCDAMGHPLTIRSTRKKNAKDKPRS